MYIGYTVLLSIISTQCLGTMHKICILPVSMPQEGHVSQHTSTCNMFNNKLDQEVNYKML